jgi:hypothetical protein
MTTSLGEFEQVVLLAILRLRDEAHAVTIRKKLPHIQIVSLRQAL